ncbi:hypothetical protein EHS13_21590 [Paenibacillus psychroresistens]|uniref:Uncharacterized protein n=1 Tax=Paenibacillus psychroresistens TaxID=1778678 RepID=A0A6B8RNE6_9BACL|nr:hypothetical protein [Paenibacillus psychroresistens]QGQ97294.1 hypothetical protein EHS13_21590 [Paenibacillus psychroresistens]
MKIIGIEGMTQKNIEYELQMGGKFVIYTYSISVLVLSFKRSSDIYFHKHNEGRVKKGLKFTLLSAVLGWWGIPWGPIYTIGALITNFGGGKDVTQEVNKYISSQVVY